jgi:hypothetical protein
MAKELIRPERFIELANSEIEAHRHFQPGMRLSLGASLPNGSYEIEYHGAGHEARRGRRPSKAHVRVRDQAVSAVLSGRSTVAAASAKNAETLGARSEASRFDRS